TGKGTHQEPDAYAGRGGKPPGAQLIRDHRVVAERRGDSTQSEGFEFCRLESCKNVLGRWSLAILIENRGLRSVAKDQGRRTKDCSFAIIDKFRHKFGMIAEVVELADTPS